MYRRYFARISTRKKIEMMAMAMETRTVTMTKMLRPSTLAEDVTIAESTTDCASLTGLSLLLPEDPPVVDGGGGGGGGTLSTYGH